MRSRESTISHGPRTSTIDHLDHAGEQHVALLDWLGRLNDATASGHPPLALIEHLATIVRDATAAESVTVDRLLDGTWARVMSVAGGAHGDESAEDHAVGPTDFLHDIVDIRTDGDDSERPGSTLPEPGTCTDRIEVPLVHDSTYGRLQLTWSEVTAFDDVSRAVVETAATLTKLVLHDSRLAEITERRARLQRAVTNGAGILVTHADDDGILTKLVDAYTDLVGARMCAIALVDSRNTTITALATRGTNSLEGPIPLRDIPGSLLGPVERQWGADPIPIDLGDDPWLRDVAGGAQAGASWYRLVPLIVGRDACGAVVLGFASERKLDPEESLAIDALTGIASAVLERSFQTKRRDHQLRRLDALHRLNSAVAQGADAAALVSHMNEVLAGRNVEVVSLAFDDRQLARQLHGDRLAGDERGSRFRSGSWDENGDGHASIPMAMGSRLVGAVRLRTVTPDSPVDPDTRQFVDDLAHGLAEVAVREQVRAAMADAHRQRTLMDEHQRIAHDLHDSVGQLFVAIRLLAEDHVESLPPNSVARDRVLRMAGLAADGKQEINHAIRGLALAPPSSDGIVASLRKLTAEFAADSGLDVEMSVDGSRARLDAATEQALFRVAHEALANAWRHARCQHIEVGLRFEPEAVVLRIVDDGVGPHGDGTHRSPTVQEGIGISGMRHAVERLGGALGVSAAEPVGTSVEVSIPGSGP